MSAGKIQRFLSADGLAGLFFLALGMFFLVSSSGYGMGSLRDIGPGFFPALAGGILAVLGLAVIGRGLVDPVSAGGIAWRPLVGVLVPVALFALSLKTVGLALAAFLLVGASMALTRQVPLRTALPVSILLAAFAVAVFGYALQIQLKLWPW
jgi:hypothetical protein